ncbi:hypothetical protein KUA24_58 [Vibrio phage HNL01]|nr:hypothetical protein KUA24_58 [Vibrio phage HNL01]
MKNLLLTTLLIFLPLTANALENDKKLHLGASFVIGGGVQWVTEDWKTSMITCTSIGLVKEVADEVSYGGFDTKDLAADVVGCTVGVLVADYGLYLYQDEGDATGVGYQFKF